MPAQDDPHGILGLVQFYLGFVGIESHLGVWAAIAELLAAIFLHFTLPLTIGTYFGAVDVLGWPWWAGVLIAAPGLLLVVPGMVVLALAPLLGKCGY